MGYSARRGFSSGSMKATGAQRQAAVQQQIAQMQEAMNAAQTEVENRSFTASVGGGAVEAVASGKKELTSLHHQARGGGPGGRGDAPGPDVAAVNEALRKAQRTPPGRCPS